MASKLMDQLARRVLVTDGAMGTMLQAAGLKSGQCGEQWNATEKAKVQEIHRAYLKAGSDIVLTNTFGGNTFRLKEYGFENQAPLFNREAAKLAREAADEFDALVFGDIGPSGQMMEPYGPVTEEEMFDAFRRQARGLVEGGVDALFVETMTSAAELAAAVRAARESAGDLPVLASFSFNRVKVGFRTMMGETIAACVEKAIAAGADIVGANCGLGIEDMIEVVKAIREVTDRPIIAQPNAGLPEVVGGKVVYRQTPQQMAARVPELIAAGAGLVGGCCGTNPEYIGLVKKLVLVKSDKGAK
jgi:5-methyltetrahydrofolate--homocysteine methyltransferase